MSILRLPLALCLNFAVAAGVAGPTHSQISEQPIKVGVITDMNGPLASATGRGSVEAARMAAEEFGFSISGRPVEILSADHQNKPDIGAAIVRRWFDVGNVNAVARRGLVNGAVISHRYDQAPATHTAPTDRATRCPATAAPA